MGDGPYGEITGGCSHSTTARSSRQSRLPARKTVLDGRRPVQSTTASTTSPTHSGKEHQLDGSIQTRPAGQKDKQAAKTIEQQRGQQAFHVNIRVLAASTDKNEAEARARGVARMFRKYYNAMTEQGLDDTPVWHRKSKRATNSASTSPGWPTASGPTAG